MEVRELALSGVLEIIPRMFHDNRGYFFETYNKADFNKIGIQTNFLQDNQSFSRKGVVRGLHMQLEPNEQIKLVRVITGKVLDVVVDCRIGSKTFGEHLVHELTEEKNNMLYIPEGFAHGFSAIEDSLFQYKCSSTYDKNSEIGINPFDKELKIDWNIEIPIVSEKDMELEDFRSYKILKGII